MIDIGLGSEVRVRPVEGRMLADSTIRHLLDALAREEGRNRHGWAPVTTRLDKHIVAIAHQGNLLIGSAQPGIQL